jgi:hypothetical protein
VIGGVACAPMLEAIGLGALAQVTLQLGFAASVALI